MNSEVTRSSCADYSAHGNGSKIYNTKQRMELYIERNYTK